MGEEIPRKKFQKIFCEILNFLLKHVPNLVFFDISENPGMAGVHIAIYHSKIVENFKILIFPKNMILDLPFGIGFIKIHLLETEDFKKNLGILRFRPKIHLKLSKIYEFQII